MKYQLTFCKLKKMEIDEELNSLKKEDLKRKKEEMEKLKKSLENEDD